MTAIIQGIGAAKAISSPPRFHVPSRRSLPGRRPGAFVARSDARGSSSSSSSSSFFFVFVVRSARADHLITNAVATKADGAAAASTGSKQGYPLDSTAA
ncbi:unnamed protein product [Rhodiola kirilowii]